MAQPAGHIHMDRIMWRQFGKPVGLTARLNAYPNMVKVMNRSLFFFFPEHHNLPWVPRCIAAPHHPQGLDCRGRLATDGLRNITGQVNRNGTVTIWGVTSTVSGGGDQGADPNKVVVITDNLGAQTLPAESFATFESARSGEVLRGVSFTPGTPGGRPLNGPRA